MPVISMCDKGILKFTLAQIEERVQRLNNPDVRQKLAKRNEEAKEFFRQVRIYDRNNMAKLTHLRIGQNSYIR